MQTLLNTLAYCGSVSLFALAFFFQYRMFRYFDLSAGAVFLIGAYVFWVMVAAGYHVGAAILVGAALSMAAGLAVTEWVARPLTRLGASALDLTLGSLGLYIIGVNAIALLFGDEVQRPSGLVIAEPIRLGGAVIAGAQLCLGVVAVLSFSVIWLVLRASRIGRVFRALSESPNLAQDLGLSVRPAMLLATATGAGLMGVGGALIAADLGVRPTTAFPFMLPGLAAVLAFGGRTLAHVLLGACVVAMAGELGGLVFGQQWREFTIFAIVALFLMGRTRLFAAIP
jgi:branched-subunit amino acid ABC-type transport system permease component